MINFSVKADTYRDPAKGGFLDICISGLNPEQEKTCITIVDPPASKRTDLSQHLHRMGGRDNGPNDAWVELTADNAEAATQLLHTLKQAGFDIQDFAQTIEAIREEGARLAPAQTGSGRGK